VSFTAAVRNARNAAGQAAAKTSALFEIVKHNGVVDRTTDALRKVAVGTAVDLADVNRQADETTAPAAVGVDVAKKSSAVSLVPAAVLNHQLAVVAAIALALIVMPLPFKGKS